MQGEKEQAVKTGVDRVLNSAARIVDAGKGAQIELAILGFATDAGVICEPTKIKASSLDQIKGKLQGYCSVGGTKIITGLGPSYDNTRRNGKKRAWSCPYIDLIK